MFKFVNTDGQADEAADIDALRKALRMGVITRDTEVTDMRLGKTFKAIALLSFHQGESSGPVRPARLEAEPPTASMRPSLAPARPAPAAVEVANAEAGLRKGATVICLASFASLPLMSGLASPGNGMLVLGGCVGVVAILALVAWGLGFKSLGAGLVAAWVSAPLLFAGSVFYAGQFAKSDTTPGTKSNAAVAPKPNQARKHLGDYQRLTQKYVKARGALQMENILKGTQLADPAGLEASRKTIEEFLALSERWLREEEMLRERLMQDLADPDIVATMKGASAASANGHLLKLPTLHAEIRDHQQKMAERLEEIMKFMSARQGSIKLQQERMVFFTEQDLEKFRTLVATVEVPETAERESLVRHDQLWDQVWKSLGIAPPPAAAPAPQSPSAPAPASATPESPAPRSGGKPAQPSPVVR